MPLTKEQIALIRETFSDEELAQLAYEWDVWARPEQLPPLGDWTIWMVMAGRGFGKTRTGAEFVRDKVEAGTHGRVALVGATGGDARDVMVEGESGLLAVCPPWNKPLYEPSKRRLTWPNGAIATLYSAEEANRLRGPQHDLAWADEVAAWEDPDTWDQLMFGLRLGPRPQVVATTTPRPTKLIRDITKRADCVVTRGKTRDNQDNLAPAFIATVVKKYEGTRLGRQELDGELLEDTPGALWTTALIDSTRLADLPKGLEFSRVVVGVDPAVTSHDDSDETGIVVAGKGAGDFRDHVFIFCDDSGRWPAASAEGASWPKRAVSNYREHRADRIVAERNNGGDLVAAVISEVDKNVPVSIVWASRGKAKRAEPVSMLFEQGRAHIIGSLPQLEDEMTTFDPEDPTAGSPNRMDAMVWAVTELIGAEMVTVL